MEPLKLEDFLNGIKNVKFRQPRAAGEAESIFRTIQWGGDPNRLEQSELNKVKARLKQFTGDKLQPFEIDRIFQEADKQRQKRTGPPAQQTTTQQHEKSVSVQRATTRSPRPGFQPGTATGSTGSHRPTPPPLRRM